MLLKTMKQKVAVIPNISTVSDELLVAIWNTAIEQARLELSSNVGYASLVSNDAAARMRTARSDVVSLKVEDDD